MGRLPAVIPGPRRWLVMALGVVILGLALAWIVPLPERLRVAGSPQVLYADGSPAHVFLTPDERWRIPVALSEVDPAYVAALVRLEDKRFYWHPGVDPLAITRAFALNLARGRVVSGASTLTMQLVRVLEPRPRTLLSKAIEALRALQLELRFSKEEILEAYLQFIPFGRNVEGVEAASLAYFGHRAAELSAAEICTLLAVPQDPSDRYPSPSHSEHLRQARDEIAGRLFALDMLPREGVGASLTQAQALEVVISTPAPDALRPFPRQAIHASVWLRQRYPGQLRIPTTLDPGVQALTERILAVAGADAARLNIHNGVAVVVNHTTAEVKALVGNFDFWDAAHGGQIPGFLVPRSVGSTLKPFLYALAIDKGLALPEFLVADVPAQFGSYRPHNFDGRFEGLVRLDYALSQSLNLPFIELLHKVGVESLLGTLSSMGARSLNPQPGHYGLTAIVGGVELTPLEMAGLYTTLAHDGLHRPLRWLKEEGVVGPGVPTLSSGACFLTRQALSVRDRPDFPARRSISAAPPDIHWKTGTSFGHRDAWAVGSGPVYTSAVWMGNFNGSPSVELVGADVAGPVLFDLLIALGARARPGMPTLPPAELRPIEVCSYSGRIPSEACPTRRQVLAPVQSVPTEVCPFHVRIDVDDQSGLALTPLCRQGRSYTPRVFTVWPSRIRRFLADQQRELPQPPSWAPGCQVGGREDAPTIVSPAPDQVAVLIPGLPAEQQEVPLEAETFGSGGSLSWFIDGAFVGTAPEGERLWWIPTPGSHEVVVVDEAGLSDRRRFEVKRGG